MDFNWEFRFIGVKIDTFLYISKEMVRQRCDNMATRYPRANVSKGSILNQGTFVSVTFGHLPLNLVTFGHLFRGLFEYIYHQTNHRIINFYDSQREYTIANDTITPARGTRKARLCCLAFSVVLAVATRVWNPLFRNMLLFK